MYTPPHFRPPSEAAVERLIHEHPFGALISVHGARPLLSHVPFLYGPGELRCHLARANPHVEILSGNAGVTVVFQGPHSYVSPTWYEGLGVPTWNYAIAEVRGTATLITDAEQVADSLAALANEHERREPVPWPPDYDARMLQGIVGVRIAIADVQAKFKLSQNKSVSDRRGVIEGLQARDPSNQTAKLMRALLNDG